MPEDRQLGRHLANRGDDLGPELGMGVHLHPLFASELLLLEEDLVTDADLADVVQEAAPLEGLHLLLVALHLPADIAGDEHDPLRVVAGEGIPLVDRVREALDGLGEHLAHLDESVMRNACRV